MHYLLGLVYIAFTFFSLTGNGLVIWVFSTWVYNVLRFIVLVYPSHFLCAVLNPCKRRPTSLWSTWQFVISWWWSRHQSSSTIPSIVDLPVEYLGNEEKKRKIVSINCKLIVILRTLLKLPNIRLHRFIVGNRGRNDQRVHCLWSLQCHHPSLWGETDTDQGVVHRLPDLGLHHSLGRSTVAGSVGSICSRYVMFQTLFSFPFTIDFFFYFHFLYPNAVISV